MSYEINSCAQFLDRVQLGLKIESCYCNYNEKNVKPEQHIDYLFKHATLQQLEAVFKFRQFAEIEHSQGHTILRQASECDLARHPCFIAVESMALAILRSLPSHKEVVKDMLTISLEFLSISLVHPKMIAFFKELNEGLRIDENLLPTQLPSISFADKYKWVIQTFHSRFGMCQDLYMGVSVTFRKQIRNASSKDVRDLAFSKIDEEKHVFAHCFKNADKTTFDRLLKIFVSKLSFKDISQLKTELGQSVSYQSLRERPINNLTTLEQKQLSIYRLMDSNSN